MNNPTKLPKIEQLALAREKLKSLGKSPTLIGKENRLKVFDLIYRWGYTTSSIAQGYLGITKGGYLQKLSDQGLLKKTKTESGKPTHIYTLSESGLQEAERHAESSIRYIEIDPYRINQQLLRHNLIAQELTINSLIAGVIDDYISERTLAVKDVAMQKRVDVVWKKAQSSIAVEVELSKKWERDLDDFILKIHSAIADKKYDRFIVFSDSKAIVNGYAEAMKPGASVRIWQKNDRGNWKTESTMVVPAWLIDKVSFQLIESHD